MNELSLAAAAVFGVLYFQRFFTTRDMKKKYDESVKKVITLEVKLTASETILNQSTEKNKELRERLMKSEHDNKLLQSRIKTYQDKLQSISNFFGEK